VWTRISVFLRRAVTSSLSELTWPSLLVRCRKGAGASSVRPAPANHSQPLNQDQHPGGNLLGSRGQSWADGEAAGEFNLLTLVLPCSQKLGQIFLYKNFYRRDVYALKLDYCCGGLIRRQTGGTMSLFLAMPILAATGLYNPQVTDRHHHCMAEAGSIQALYCPAPATPAAPAHHPRHAKR
jgi:hypothetical protein